MSIINRYILRNHIGPFLFGFSTIVFIYLMKFLIENLGELVGKGLDNWVIVQLVVFNLSWMVVLAVPMGVLFSTLMAFGSMSASYEIAIIKSSGSGLIKMMGPMLIIGLVMSYLLFLFNNKVLPESNHQSKVLLMDIKRTKPTFKIVSGLFSNQLPGYTILARKMDSSTGLMQNVTIYDNSKVKTYSVINANSGEVKFNKNYTSLNVELKVGEIHQIVKNEVDNYRIIDFKTFNLIIPADGYGFSRTENEVISRGQRELSIESMSVIKNEALRRSKLASDKIDSLIMSLNNKKIMLSSPTPPRIPLDISSSLRIKSGRVSEVKYKPRVTPPQATPVESQQKIMLRNLIRKIDFVQGQAKTQLYEYTQNMNEADQYEVEIQKKYAIPFACFVFVFVGCPLGIRTKNGNFGISAAFTLLFYLIYWVCLIGGEKLADRSYVSPFMSMWLGNIIIGLIGVYLTILVNNENFSVKNMIFKLFRIKSYS